LFLLISGSKIVKSNEITYRIYFAFGFYCLVGGSIINNSFQFLKKIYSKNFFSTLTTICLAPKYPNAILVDKNSTFISIID